MQSNEQPPESTNPEQPQDNSNQEIPPSREDADAIARFFFVLIKQALVGDEPTAPVWVLPEPNPRTENSQP